MRAVPPQLLPLFLLLWLAPPSTASERSMAITVDDLPVNSLSGDVEAWREITDGLIAHLESYEVPAIGFVNEEKLHRDGVLDEERRQLLERWLEAGLDLGNHGFAHLDLNDTPLELYQRDLLRGEEVLRPLLAARDRSPHFFRHPYLHTGTDLDTRDRLLRFLDDHGYRVAPVTIDNSEWIFARAYERALQYGDRELARRIAEAYPDYMLRKVAYYESQSRDLFGREIAQVLLLHANRLNADHLAPLLRGLRDRGYRFVSLERALEDPAYESDDRWAGPQGISWLHRWALTREVDPDFFAGEPTAPPFVLEAAGIARE